MLRREFLCGSSLTAGLSASGIFAAAPVLHVKSILEFGSIADGKTLNTRAIQRTIDDVYQAGGGIVYAPPGTFLTGGLVLKSRVTLYLESGCTLLGSTSIDDYEYHPGPPVQGDANGHHLIFAQNADDITICGSGTIDGQGEAYWENIHRPPMPPDQAWRDVSAWDYRPKNHNRRPSPMLEFANCRNVRLSGFTLRNSAGWTIRPIACETVVIDGIRVRNPNYGSNTDGIDITACSNVFVSNCDISVGDDAICIKSENPYGEVLPTRNITITNCTLTTSCNGFKMGTASRGAFENIVFSNSVIYSSTGSPFNTRVIGGINVEVVDGGSADGVVVSNIRMQNVRTPIFVRLGQRTSKKGTFLRNVLIDGIDAEGAIIASSITGIPGLRPSDVSVSNCRIRTVAGGQAEWAQREIPEVIDQYPESTMMGRLPAFGFYCRHADRIRLRDIECIADAADARPAIACDDVEDIILSGLELSAPAGETPLINLRDTRRVFLTGSRSPEKARIFAQVSGVRSQNIELLGNAVPRDQEVLRRIDGATEESVEIH